MKIVLFFCTFCAFSADEYVEIDNPQVKILSVTNAARAKGKMQQHDSNRVMIYLDPGSQTLTGPDGKIEETNWQAGEAKWRPAAGPQIEENVTEKAVRIIEVELKNPPNGGAVKWPERDPVRVDPRHYHVELENAQVRVYRLKYEPHQKGTQHEHVLNRVVVILTDGTLRITAADGTATERQYKVGQVGFGRPRIDTEENVGDDAFEMIAVELKP